MFDICVRRKRAKIIDFKGASFGHGNGRSSLTKRSIVSLYLCNKSLELSIQRDTLHAEDQFVKLLSVVRSDYETRIDILVNEHIIENNHVWQCSIPSAVLKHC